MLRIGLAVLCFYTFNNVAVANGNNVEVIKTPVVIEKKEEKVESPSLLTEKTNIASNILKGVMATVNSIKQNDYGQQTKEGSVSYEDTMVKEPSLPYLQKKVDDWDVLYEKEKGKISRCYIVGRPYDSVDNYKLNRRPYFMIVLDERRRIKIYVATGYEYCRHSEVPISIDESGFSLLSTDYYVAVTPDFMMDLKILQKMLEGEKMLVHGRSIEGNYSVDSYSLVGFIEAYSTMSSICKSSKHNG